MKIVVLEPIGIAKEKITAIAESTLDARYELVCYDTKITDVPGLIERAKDSDVLVIANMKLEQAVVEACPNLKLISVAFTGVDHIPMSYCKEKGIMVCNCAGYSNTAVSELVFGMALSLYRYLLPCDKATHEGGTRVGMIGREICGKKFGIIGAGAIGLRTAALAKAFGCEVYAYSRTKKEIDGVQFVDLDTLMSICDIISVHVPLNDSTKGLIGKEQIAKMKKTAILINTARGPVVDSTALADALNSGAIAGAGIDVFETEPPIAEDHVLLHTPNTVVAPHIGFATKEALEIRAQMVFDNIKAWNDGAPINVM